MHIGTNSERKEKLKDIYQLVEYLKENGLSLICNRDRNIEVWKDSKMIYERYMINCGEEIKYP